MSTKAFHTVKPLRVRIPNVLDVVFVSDAEQIRWLNQHPAIVRPLDPTRSWLHRWLDRRTRRDMSIDGKSLPVFDARDDARRSELQHVLATSFSSLRGMPGPECDAIADYLTGRKVSADIGVIVQQWCGRLFSDRYRSSPETYAAGRMLAEWASAPSWRTLRARWNGALTHAKAMLAAAAHGDMHCVHGTSLGMENIVRTVHKLRQLSLDPEKRKGSAEAALRECLVAPPLVLRACDDVVGPPFLDDPLGPRTLIVFLVARAFARSGDLDDAFLADSWSACPARSAIQEMLGIAWRSAHHHDAEVERLLSIHSWSRLWHRAVS